MEEEIVEKGAESRMEDKGCDELLKELEELVKDAKIGKDKHFFASERAQRWHVWVGLPCIAINVLLGSVFFTTTAIVKAEVASVLGPTLAYFAATLGAVQTFFNFQTVMEGHRAVGNRYLAVAKHAQLLVSGARSGHVSPTVVWTELEQLIPVYNQINTDAAKFRTIARDYRRALRKRMQKAEG